MCFLKNLSCHVMNGFNTKRDHLLFVPFPLTPVTCLWLHIGYVCIIIKDFIIRRIYTNVQVRNYCSVCVSLSLSHSHSDYMCGAKRDNLLFVPLPPSLPPPTLAPPRPFPCLRLYIFYTCRPHMEVYIYILRTIASTACSDA